jgi:membrane protease YdiL (CAAX protease family)
MLWKNPWQPEAVMMLIGGIALSFFSGNLAVELLHQSSVVGFKTLNDAGSVLIATLCFHGMAIVLGIPFLRLHRISLSDALGWHEPKVKQNLLLAVGLLAIVVPMMFALKFLSGELLHRIGWPLEDQRAVEIFAGTKSPWIRAYLAFFAVAVAPVAEEFVFRGLMFSGLKKLGWHQGAWIVTSLMFAAIHNSAAILLPLFVFALALTWLYQKTEGLLAPIVAHGLFNAVNLALLIAAGK